MKELSPAIPGYWQRAIAAVLFAAPSAFLVWMIANSAFFLMRWLLGAFLLTFASVFFAAVWRHGFRWLFSRRALRFHAGAVAAAITLVVLFYTEESWRGKRAWAALQREASARGESLEFSSLAAPAVPDDQNFAKDPRVVELLGLTNQLNAGLPFYHGSEEKWLSAGWALQQFTDLPGWQKFFRKHPEKSVAPDRGAHALNFPVTSEPQTPAADVLVALGKSETNLTTLRAASQRPLLRLPLDYSKGFFLREEPNLPLQSLQEATHLLSLRASAEQQQGQSEAAFQDVLLALRLVDLVSEEPSHYLQWHPWDMTQFCLQPIWEGLAAHRWNDTQLAALQKKLGEVDFLADYRRVLRGETLARMNLFDQWLAFIGHRPSELARHMSPSAPEGGEGLGDWAAKVAIRSYPVGWLYQDKVWLYRFYQRHGDPLDTAALRDQPWEKWKAGVPTLTDPIMGVLLPPVLCDEFEGSSLGYLMTQSFVQQAVTACALERFRLEQGNYPDALEALVPNFLQQIPADLLVPTAAKLKYLRTPDGGFRLYSVGFNGVDHGGKPNPSINPHQDLLQQLSKGDCDLVWIQPGHR
jgi:hypothetical protein